MSMRIWWFIAVLGCALFGILWGFRRDTRVVDAPFLFAIGLSIIVCPQVLIAVIQPHLVPDEPFWTYCLMAVLCSVMLYAGYLSSGAQPPIRRRTWMVNDRRLFAIGAVCAGAGGIGYAGLLRLGTVEAWTGSAVYWATLGKLALPGIALVFLSHQYRPSRGRLLAAIGLAIFPFLVVVALGRRSMAILLPFVFLVPYVLMKQRVRAPRLGVIVSAVLLAVIVYAFPAWRGEFASGRHLSVIAERPVAIVFEDLFAGDEDRHLEVTDAMVFTGAHYATNRIGWGIPKLINSLIDLYVPAALVGRGVKEALYVRTGTDTDWVAGVYGIPVAFYTSKGAFAELFGEFWFAGSLIFWWVGRVFRRLRNGADARDPRAIIALSLFGSFPAALPYGAFIYWLVTQLPQAIVLWVAIEWCVKSFFSLPPRAVLGGADA